MRVPRTPIDDTRPPTFSLSLLGRFEALHEALARPNATADMRLHARVDIAIGLVVGEPLATGAGERIAIGEAPDSAAPTPGMSGSN